MGAKTKNTNPLKLRIYITKGGQFFYDKDGNIANENQIVAYPTKREFDMAIKQLPLFGYDYIEVVSKDGGLLAQDKKGEIVSIGEEYYGEMIEEINSKLKTTNKTPEQKLLEKLENLEKANSEMTKKLEKLEEKSKPKTTLKKDAPLGE